MAGLPIFIVSIVLLCYWMRRVLILLHRPDEIAGILQNDYRRCREVMNNLHMLVLPAVACSSRYS